jgi:hypothetical protein
MLNRLAAVFLIGAAWFGSAMLFPSPAAAQVINSRQAVCDPQYPTRCIKPAADGSIAVTGGGGGGGSGATASAAATPVVAGTNKPLNIDLFSSLRVLNMDSSGNPLDPNAALPTGSNVIGALVANQSVNLSQVGAVTTATGNGVATTGTQRVSIASDNTAFAVIPSNVVAQGSTTSGQTGGLTQGAVTTAAPSYTTAQTSPLSLTTTGSLRTFPSGITANGGTDTTTNPILIGGKQFGTNTVNGWAIDAGGTGRVVLYSKGQQVPQSAATLGIGATFTGVSTNVQAAFQTINFFYYNASAYADQAGILSIEFSYDNTTWYTAKSIAVIANTYTELFVKVTQQYYRVKYVNGGVANTVFKLAVSTTDG